MEVGTISTACLTRGGGDVLGSALSDSAQMLRPRHYPRLEREQ